MKAITQNVPPLLLYLAIHFLALVLLFKPFQPIVGSNASGSEYQGTTTVNGVFQPEIQLQSTGGTLGSVTLANQANGIINLYDATTSNINLRGNTATSSLLVATI